MSAFLPLTCAAAFTSGIWAPDGAVSVKGAVNSPGQVAVTGPTSLGATLKQLGGARTDADLKRIVVTSADGSKRTVDLTHLGVIPSVKPGDVVNVPVANPSNYISVRGYVANSCTLDFKPGMTLKDALCASAPLQTAGLKKVEVIRQSANGQSEKHAFELAAVISPTAESVALKPGDKVVVPRSFTASDRELITILVIGLLIIVLVR